MTFSTMAKFKNAYMLLKKLFKCSKGQMFAISLQNIYTVSLNFMYCLM